VTLLLYTVLHCAALLHKCGCCASGCRLRAFAPPEFSIKGPPLPSTPIYATTPARNVKSRQ